jgi:hypothetical protein
VKPYFNSDGEERTLNREEQTQVLKTLQDFSSIMPAIKLSNYFLSSFTEVSMEQEMTKGLENSSIMLKLDVIIALIDKVKL